MEKQERHRRLIQMMKTDGRLPIRAYADRLSVSEMTIRRDLAELGAQSSPEVISDLQPAYAGYDLITELQKSYEQKRKIGELAASLIKPGDTLTVDTGSTTARMLPFLPENYGLTVLCFNTNVLMDLRYRMDIELLFCGGIYHRSTEMFESPEGIQFLRRMRANKAFLSAAGVHRDLGVTCAYEYEVFTKQAILESSLERILLVDSGKFNQVKASYYCDLSDINVIVTDKGLDEDWQEVLYEKEITLYLA